MAEYTQEVLQESYNTIETMIELLEKSMIRLHEGTSSYVLLGNKMKAFNISRSLIQSELHAVQDDNSTKEELEAALQVIDSEKSKLEYAPPQMNCCRKLKTLLIRQILTLSVASTLLNKELGQLA